ncbi:O-antigen translocase [Vibrio splendidus]|uniref:O-antigen translocase n=1 Tax=Vibrio splendidus TaxID=29497 RepID=UPI003D10D98E
MNLVKTSLLSFIATVIKMLSGLVINKAVAIFIGPAGLAIIGQFQNIQGIIRTVAQGGINSGITKYTAEYYNDELQRANLWSTSLKITIGLSLVVSFLIIITSKQLSIYTFNEGSYRYVFIVFGFTLFLFSINQLLLSVLNGLKEIREFISINITQSLYSLVFTTFLIVFWQLDGALFALVTNQSIIFFVLLYRLRNHALITWESLNKSFDKEIVIKLSKYSLMTLASISTVPVSQLYVRNFIGENLSWADAGYWQAMMYISTMYLMVVTTALSTYYLPRLSEINSRLELRRELIDGYKIITPLIALITISVFFSKNIVLWILFSEDFEPMLVLFKWQLLGDFLKINSWLLGYILIAKAKTKTVISTEIFFSITFAVLSVVFVDLFGLVGVSYAYAINYLFHLITMFFVTRRLR